MMKIWQFIRDLLKNKIMFNNIIYRVSVANKEKFFNFTT